MTDGVWLLRFVPRPGCDVRLFCFHHAGVGAAGYRPWALALPERIEVCAVELPGRGNRLREAPLKSVDEIVARLLPRLEPELDRPFVFFGHSMGAVLAYETALALRARGRALPEHLFVSGRRPPHLPDPLSPLAGLPDDAFVAAINRRYGGIPSALLQHADVMALLLPALRADIHALEAHRPAQARAPLPCPITALGGEADAATPAEHLDAWRPLTAAAFTTRRYPGDHFYLDARRADVLAEVSAAAQAAELARE